MQIFLMKVISVFVILGTILMTGHYYQWWEYHVFVILAFGLFLTMISFMSLFDRFEFRISLMNPYNLTGIIVGIILCLSQHPFNIISKQDSIFFMGLTSCVIFSSYTLIQAYMPMKVLQPAKNKVNKRG